MDWQDQINEIMDCFNFGKVAKAMAALDWKWAGLDNPGDDSRVPEEWEIRGEARRLLIKAANDTNPFISCATGGLRADKDDEHLTLSFILEDWQAG